MKIFNLFFLLINLLLFFGCNKDENNLTKNQEGKLLLTAIQKVSFLDKIERTLKIYSDSTFVFTELMDNEAHNKIETWKGFAVIKGDTLNFPFRLPYNRAKKAVINNGFAEFFDGEYPDRMKIESTILPIENSIDFRNFTDYAVFTYYNHFSFQPSQKQFVNYKLTTKYLFRIDNILKKAFQDHKELRNYTEYLKQLESVKNEKGENLIFIHCYCKDPRTTDYFQYQQTSMSDGGNCNVYIELNLTTGKIQILNIAGMA